MDSDYFTQSQNTSTVKSSTVNALAGTINKIHVKNFMCHDNLEVNLNPRINFICGKNGSGKSAIQTAIAVGFGGRALATNRGSSLKALIKNGRNTASVSISINNGGKLAYQPNIYGPIITVDRTFSHTSGGYKIKNASGKVVATERKEVDRITEHFNIQTDNPVCILHQDTARNFLNSSDPKSKFKFFMKASRYDDITKLYDESRMRVLSMKESILEKFECAKESFKDVLEVAKRLKTLEEAKAKEVVRERLENELVWAKITEDNSQLAELNQAKEVETKSKLKYEKSMEEYTNDKFDENIKELQEQIQAIDEQVKDAREQVRPARNLYSEKRDEFNGLKNRFIDIKKRVQFSQQKYTGCCTEIEKLTTVSQSTKEQQDRLKQQVAECETELQSIRAALQSFEHDKQQLADTMAQVRGNLNSLEEQIRIKQRVQDKRTQQRNQLKSGSSSVSIYGNVMVQIVDEVETAAAQRKFRQKPVGPIGIHVKVRDAAWAGPVENFLNKQFLSTFCVDNSADAAVLGAIFRRVCGRNNASQPPVICSKFLQTVHNIGPHEVRHPQFSSLAAALDISHPVVANCLIDTMEIESVLLIPTNQQAYQLLDTAHNVPRNCKKAFTMTGDQFFPAPNYKSYSSSRSVEHATFLQSNQEAALREIEREIRLLAVEIQEVDEEKQNVHKQMRDTTDALVNNESELKNLKRQKYLLETKINELKGAIEPENEMNVGFLDDEKAELLAKLQSDKEKLQKITNDVEKVQKELEEAAGNYDRLKNTLAETDQKKTIMLNEIQRLQSSKQQSQHRSDLLRDKIRRHNEKLSQLDSQITELSERIDHHTQNASQMCQPIDTQRSSEEINRELKQIIAYLDKIRQENGTYAKVQGDFKEKQKAFNNINKDLTSLRALVEKTQVSLIKRKKKEQRLHWVSSVSAKHSFIDFLSERNFDGKLEFDFEKQTLEIKVKPLYEEGPSQKKHDTSSLSGGEKSFSTVCFIMALWQEMELPFHFLDEFDVFMDGINRRIVMDMLISYAKRVKQQFVLLTPLDMSSIAPSEIISIHKMAAPRQ